MKSLSFFRLGLVMLLALAGPGKSVAADPAPVAPAQTAEKARALELRDLLVAIGKESDPSQASWDGLRDKIDGYQKEFGVTPATSNNVVILRKFELSVARKFSDPARYNALLRQLATDPLPAVAEMAGAQLAVQTRVDDLKTKPIELQFTALDDSPVDLAKLRGKVVLLDFWAVWCPECVTEEPALVDVYRKYHGQGLEVVGVSLDTDKAKVLAFTQKLGMAWPEYFDGKQWKNDLSTRFGITSIPAVWLFDKSGRLVTKDGRADLAGQVAALLKNP